MKRHRSSARRSFGLERATHEDPTGEDAFDIGEDPGTAAARGRVEALLVELARINLHVIVVD